MDRLPPEIKQYVCSFLTPEDLKDLRLVSKDLAAAAIPHFIPRIFLFNHPDSCTEVLRIIAHPELKKYVNTIVIDPRDIMRFDGFDDWVDHMPDHWQIPSWKDYEPQFPPEPDIDGIIKTWNQAMEEARKLYLDHFTDAKYSESELRSLWGHHRILQREQKHGYLKRSLASVIQDAFDQCPKLENVVVTSEHYPDSAVVTRKRNELFRSILLAFTKPGSRYRAHPPVIGLNLDDVVVRNTLSTLTMLHVEFPMPDCDLTMSNLRHLHVTFRMCERDPNAVLDQILRSAHRLETLWVNYPVSPFGTAYGLNSTLRTTRYDNLRECLIAGCLASEDQLVDFLLCHASSLQTLGLGEIHLMGGTWPSLFRRISCRLLVLTKISFVGLFAGPRHVHADRYTHAVQSYILKGGPEPVEATVRDDEYEDLLDSPSIITETQKGLWEDIDMRVNTFF